MTFRAFLLIGALAVLALLTGCSYSGEYSGVYVYAGADVAQCEGQPLPERTPTPEVITPFATAYPTTTHPTAVTTPQSACVGTVTSATGLNVRERPELNAPIIGGLRHGQQIDLHARAGFNEYWYRIWGNDADVRGYVYARWIAPDPTCWRLTGE